MSRNWIFPLVSRHWMPLALVAYAVVLTGCRPAEVASPPKTSDVSDHDHTGHDHDHEGHDHEGHDHAGHDHESEIDIDALMPIESVPAPENLAAGIEQLKTLRDTVAKGFADDDVDSIHDQLHSVGNLLENIESLVDSSELSKEAKAEATAAVEELFEAYGQVDAKLHGSEGQDYADVSDEIDSAVDKLSKLASSAT